jgi:glycosyltransferase involved in cell wall biosynthesis
MTMRNVTEDVTPVEVANLERDLKVLTSELEQSRSLLARLERLVETQAQELTTVYRSPAWQIARRLGPLRARLLPEGSTRETLWWRFWHATHVAVSRMRSGGPNRDQISAPERPIASARHKRLRAPCLSIVHNASLQTEMLEEWLNSQTLPRSAVRLCSPEAFDTDAHMTPYACVASEFLLSEPPGFLESALISLHARDLTFLVSVHGQPAWVQRQFRHRAFPSTGKYGPERMIFRSESLQAGQLIINPHPAGNMAGRVLFQTGLIPDSYRTLNLSDQTPSPGLVCDGVRWEWPDETKPNSDHVEIDRTIELEQSADHRPTVLVYTPYFAVGGAERVVIDMIRQLREQIRFVFLSTEQSPAGAGSMLGALRELTPFVFEGNELAEPRQHLSLLRYLIDRFSARTFYAANCNEWVFEAAKHLSVQYPDLRIALQVYDTQMGWINRVHKESVECFDAFIGCNRAICEAYVQRGVPKTDAFLVECCVDAERFNPSEFDRARVSALKVKFGLREDRRVILFASRMHPQKRPLDILEVARRYLHRTEIIFFVVGDGPLSNKFDMEIQRLGLTNVIRQGFHDLSSELHAVADALLLPSAYEGMPMVILESLAMGNPVVATRVGNNEEVLNNAGIKDLVVDPGDISGMAAAIELALQIRENPSARLTLRESVIERYSPAKMAAKYARALVT